MFALAMSARVSFKSVMNWRTSSAVQSAPCPGIYFASGGAAAKTFSTPALAYQAEHDNDRRWLTFDLDNPGSVINRSGNPVPVPRVVGDIARRGAIQARDVAFLRAHTDRTVKIALPGPYLLTQIMWMECISDKAYGSREELAGDIVQSARRASRTLVGRRGFGAVR